MITVQKIGNKPRADTVFEQLRDLIVQGHIAPEGQLPSETSLAQQFAVSRMTVRSALQRLQLLDYITIQHGKGSFVRKENWWANMGNALENVGLSRKTFSDLREFRLSIELKAIELACLRGTQGNFAILREHLDGLRDARTEEDYIRSDILFHGSIVAAAQNDIFTACFTQLQNTYREYFRALSRFSDSTERRAKALQNHENLYQLVVSGKSEEAVDFYRQHMGVVYEVKN